MEERIRDPIRTGFTPRRGAEVSMSLILKCLRCGHEWMRRKIDRPKQCPGCHSPYWDKVRIK